MEEAKKRFEQNVQAAKGQMSWFKKNFNEDSFGRVTNSAVMAVFAALRPLFMTEKCMTSCTHPVVTIVGTRMIRSVQNATKTEFVEVLLFDFRSMKFFFHQMTMMEAVPFFMATHLVASSGHLPVPQNSIETSLDELHSIGLTPMWVVNCMDKGVEHVMFSMEAAAATQQPAEA